MPNHNEYVIWSLQKTLFLHQGFSETMPVAMFLFFLSLKTWSLHAPSLLCLPQQDGHGHYFSQGFFPRVSSDVDPTFINLDELLGCSPRDFGGSHVSSDMGPPIKFIQLMHPGVSFAASSRTGSRSAPAARMRGRDLRGTGLGFLRAACGTRGVRER